MAMGWRWDGDGMEMAMAMRVVEVGMGMDQYILCTVQKIGQTYEWEAEWLLVDLKCLVNEIVNVY